MTAISWCGSGGGSDGSHLVVVAPHPGVVEGYKQQEQQQEQDDSIKAAAG